MGPGVTIEGRFLIGSKVDEGGMGTIYRAVDLITRVPVAVKVLHRSSPADAERFSRETAVLRELSHPNIVRYVEHGTTLEGQPYLVMEWVDGQTVADRLDERGMTVRESVALGAAVARGLHAMHQRGVLHRDIKPRNLIIPLANEPRAKILDFGIARHVVQEGGPTQVGMMIGSLGYMAPEQARGLGEVDLRTDVFALGCVLYECLTGRPAFEGSDPMAVRAKVLLVNPPLIRELNEGVSLALENLVSRMMEKKPELRPPDAHWVAEALDALDEAEGALRKRAAAHDAKTLVSAAESSGTVSPRTYLIMLEGSAATEGLGDSSDDRTLTFDGPGDPSEQPAIEEAVLHFGGEVNLLPEGWYAVTLSGNPASPALTDHAANCALALRERFPLLPMLLSAQENNGEPLEDLIERSVRSALEESIGAVLSQIQDRPVAGAIRLDHVTSELLGDRFTVVTAKAGRYLVQSGTS